ncbi:hypothetical protein ABW19_dt0201948 [Dactylella cylindrospora]|nr:hypothetical protein ABW19_dt0201948 [Dactylella cylindrospora]
MAPAKSSDKDCRSSKSSALAKSFARDKKFVLINGVLTLRKQANAQKGHEQGRQVPRRPGKFGGQPQSARGPAVAEKVRASIPVAPPARPTQVPSLPSAPRTPSVHSLVGLETPSATPESFLAEEMNGVDGDDVFAFSDVETVIHYDIEDELDWESSDSEDNCCGDDVTLAEESVQDELVECTDHADLDDSTWSSASDSTEEDSEEEMQPASKDGIGKYDYYAYHPSEDLPTIPEAEDEPAYDAGAGVRKYLAGLERRQKRRWASERTRRRLSAPHPSKIPRLVRRP